jgi:uracil phosphoribosyltransferase
MLTILGKGNSLLSQFIAEIRDAEMQKDKLRFRNNMTRIGEIFAYEISKKLSWKEVETTTPLGIAKSSILKTQPVLATILRAGLPFHQGLLNYFDKADNAFVSAYRKHQKDGKFDISIEYISSPSVDKRILILSDPMLATGSSMYLCYKALLQKGVPEHTHFVSIVASTQGINYLQKQLPAKTNIWVGEVDEELTAQSYIVPGLGDAGDLAFGVKE